MSVHLVTGATGLVGAALVLELLQRTDDEVICVTRPGRSDPGERLIARLNEAAEAYDLPLERDIEKRCRVLAGDVIEPLCGIDPAVAGRVHEVWHSAADLRYEDKHWEALQRTNIIGTRNVLDLAEAVGAEVVNQVSTAYVAGRRTGLVLEEAASAEVPTNNRYEDSKIAAELVAAEAGIPVRVMRPSIVIGHSVTKAVVGGISGLYGIQKRIHQLRRVQRILGEPLKVRLRADEETLLNFVPVDLVARDAVSISLAGGGVGVFHLTHPNPLTLHPALDRVFELSGLPAPSYVSDTEGFTRVDHEFDRKITFYRSYLTGTKVFDQSVLSAVVPDSALRSWQFDLAELHAFAAWHCERLGTFS
ncbi:SDR family oxidoreductase [Lentzea jiangxiensis]|uniref:Thioester reductase domain-containing protein n=1 Tax=Lentzea jiangxiensis TaxID=641025 RepID=A0A1H0X3I0_9PSEU|nr:SDR family oxidoreductase [Lentzea jiangxiensis]SDP97399.1 Thioester reductase domain-containing protein [Lentzea jiangxiensis]